MCSAFFLCLFFCFLFFFFFFFFGKEWFSYLLGLPAWDMQPAMGTGLPSGFCRDLFKQLVLFSVNDFRFLQTQFVATEMAETRLFLGGSPARPYEAGVTLKCPDHGIAGTPSPE